MDPRGDRVGSTSRATTSANTSMNKPTFKRRQEICNDVKVAYAIRPLNEDVEPMIVNVLHNDEAYVHIAVHHGGDAIDDLYVRLEELPSIVKYVNAYPMLFMPKYDDIMAALPSDYDLLIEE